MTDQQTAILAALKAGRLYRSQIAKSIGVADPRRIEEDLLHLMTRDHLTRHDTRPRSYSLPDWQPEPEPVEADTKPVRQQIPTLRTTRMDGGAVGTMHMVSVAPWPGSGPAPWEVTA